MDNANEEKFKSRWLSVPIIAILLKLTDGHFENAKIKVKKAKLRSYGLHRKVSCGLMENPDKVGMVVFIIFCFT